MSIEKTHEVDESVQGCAMPDLHPSTDESAVQGWSWSFGGGPNGPLTVSMRHPGLTDCLSAESWRYTADARKNVAYSLAKLAGEKGLPLTEAQLSGLQRELDAWLDA